MLKAIPNNFLSWDFTVFDGQTAVADIDISWWREKGTLSIESQEYQVYREGFLSGRFVLEQNEQLIAQAEKPSVLSRSMLITIGNQKYTLKPKGFLSRRFVLLNDSNKVGELSPIGVFSRKMNIDLAEEMTLPAKVFIVWLTVILWKRESDAASSSG